MAPDGWSGLFASAFTQSGNPMVLVDGERRIVAANPAFGRLLGHTPRALHGRQVFAYIAGGPLATPAEWHEALGQGRFTGRAALLHRDGSEVPVQWAGTTEVVTGRRLVLFVALTTSRWGSHFRRPRGNEARAALSPREREVVQLVADGASGPEIATELGISHETVRTHVRNAMDKLGARSRAHLVAKALGEALVEP